MINKQATNFLRFLTKNNAKITYSLAVSSLIVVTIIGWTPTNFAVVIGLFALSYCLVLFCAIFISAAEDILS